MNIESQGERKICSYCNLVVLGDIDDHEMNCGEMHPGSKDSSSSNSRPFFQDRELSMPCTAQKPRFHSNFYSQPNSCSKYIDRSPPVYCPSCKSLIPDFAVQGFLETGNIVKCWFCGWEVPWSALPENSVAKARKEIEKLERKINEHLKHINRMIRDERSSVANQGVFRSEKVCGNCQSMMIIHKDEEYYFFGGTYLCTRCFHLKLKEMEQMEFRHPSHETGPRQNYSQMNENYPPIGIQNPQEANSGRHRQNIVESFKKGCEEFKEEERPVRNLVEEPGSARFLSVPIPSENEENSSGKSSCSSVLSQVPCDICGIQIPFCEFDKHVKTCLENFKKRQRSRKFKKEKKEEEIRLKVREVRFKNAPTTPLTEEEMKTLVIRAFRPIMAHSKESKSCPYCLDEFRENDSVLFLPCMHLYHESCIKPWMSKKCTCPLCHCNVRVGLKEENLI